MNRSSIRNAIIALTLFCLAAASFGFMLHQVNVEGDSLTEQISILETRQAQEASYFRLLKTFEESETDREKLQSYFLQKESDSIDFLNKVEALAPQAGVELQTSGLELITDPTDETKWIEVGFSVKGTRDRLRVFLQILEQLPTASRLMSVDMKAISRTEWQASVKMRVRVLAYDQ